MNDSPTTDTGRIIATASFAAQRHRRCRRKDAEATPYINHPLRVAEILSENGVEDADILCAALLHDTVEDTETSPQEIADRFGERVAGFVAEVTDDKALPKDVRKRRQVESAPGKTDGAKMIKIADKICNLEDLAASPPDWDAQRIAEYRNWAKQVVTACGPVHAGLVAQFESHG